MTERAPDHGNLNEHYIADILAPIFTEKRTGTLRVEKGSYLKIVYFKDGKIAYATSNAQFDRLGEVLVRSGLLTHEQLEDAMKRMDQKTSLGKLLIQLGYLNPKELVQGARLQVYTIVDSIFQWDEGSYHFTEAPLPKQVVNLNIPIPAIYLDGISSHAPMTWLRKLIPEGYTASLLLNEQFYAIQSELELRPNVEEVISWFDGELTIEEIASKTGLNEFFIAKVMAALSKLSLGTLQLKAKPSAEGEEIPGESEQVQESEPTEVMSFDEEIASALSVFTTDQAQTLQAKPEVSETEKTRIPSADVPSTPQPAQTVEVQKPPAREEIPEASLDEGHPHLQEEIPYPADLVSNHEEMEEEESTEHPAEVAQDEDLRNLLGGSTLAWPRHRERKKLRKKQSFFSLAVGLFILVLIVGGGYFSYIKYFKKPGSSKHIVKNDIKVSKSEEPSEPLPAVQPERPPVEVIKPPSDEGEPTESAPSELTTEEKVPSEPDTKKSVSSENIRSQTPVQTPESPQPPPVQPQQEPEKKPRAETPPVQPQKPGVLQKTQTPSSTFPGRPPALSSPVDYVQLNQISQAAYEWLKRNRTKWTIQAVWACQIETVESFLRDVEQPDNVFVLRQDLKKKPCYIVFYGLYASKQEALLHRNRDIPQSYLQEKYPPMPRSVKSILARYKPQQ